MVQFAPCYPLTYAETWCETNEECLKNQPLNFVLKYACLQWWWPITFQTEKDTRSESSDMTMSTSEEDEAAGDADPTTAPVAAMANGSKKTD